MLARPLSAEELSDGWAAIESAFFTIQVQSGCDLKALEKKLKKRYFYFAARPLLDPLSTMEERLAYRFDLLFLKTKDILDMDIPAVNIKVKIYQNKEDMLDEYYRIFKEKEITEAFYVYKFNTIYANERDISDSVMVHEIAHAITDHYFAIHPPPKIKEIISQYVDEHLED